jgi:hypothetical protein
LPACCTSRTRSGSRWHKPSAIRAVSREGAGPRDSAAHHAGADRRISGLRGLNTGDCHETAAADPLPRHRAVGRR